MSFFVFACPGGGTTFILYPILPNDKPNPNSSGYSDFNHNPLTCHNKCAIAGEVLS